MARQLEQRFVERPRCGRFRHPAAHLERVTLSRQVQRRIERMQTVVTGMRVAQALDRHRAKGRLQLPVVQPPLRTLDTVGPLDRTRRLPRGCVGRGALAGACASTPDHAGSTPVRGRSHASAGPRAKKGRLWSPRKKPPPPHRAPGRVERCGGEQLAWLNAPVTAACPGRAPAPRWPGSSSVRIKAPATRGG